GVELAALATRVGSRRQVRQQRLIVRTSCEVRDENMGIDTAEDRPKAQGEEVPGQAVRVAIPQWEDAGQPRPGEQILAVGSHILQKDVSADDRRDALRAEPLQ